ncbi:MAG TPA: phosphoribosylglycinamide formyltransferase [Alphaproteobacteria bacterium]|nr:phosphoribosylglycinamide formyltransferase [Alphaproteobacteria bacterium]HAJ45315.1 phosphoribosylglycinamide formyltransferase [Alphaproteobacteria bacterium]
MRLRGAIFISGRGSNMRALLEASREPAFPLTFVLVVSDREAEGLAAAREFGVEAFSIPWNKGAAIPAIQHALESRGVDWVCLAGFMRILPAGFVARWKGRMLNIHPSLLPAFKGLHAIGQALRAGVIETGCTVHWVEPDVDAGPTVLQARVPVHAGDTAETLAARIHAAEHALYPEAVKLAVTQSLRGDPKHDPH